MARTTTKPNGRLQEPGSRAVSAYQAVKRDIIRCRLEPDSQITEAQVAERYGVSRGTMHAALNRLGHEGFVQVLPREGYIVTPISLRYVDDLYTARRALEPFAARIAAEHVSREIERAEPGRSQNFDWDELIRLAEAASVPGRLTELADMERTISANREFHLAVARASRSERLLSMIESLMDEADRLSWFAHLRPGTTRDDYPQHEEVVRALQAGDTAAAEEAMSRHISRGQEWIFDALISSPSIRTVSLTLS